MTEDRRFDEAIKVDRIEAEYHIIRMTPCSKCGGMLVARTQTLLTDEKTGRHYDAIETLCVQCATPREFLFDIDSYFGKTS